MSETSQVAPTAVSRRRPLRAEIQALRAIAVAGVVSYHLWPGFIPGGYVGVDVFFVVSGFLIIGHLLTEFEATGRIDLAKFWSRRARRLLPASAVVLLATGVAIVALTPQLLWMQWFKQLAGSAAFVQNWVLARDAVDYLRAEAGPSPVQHFWSLSVEEQFYFFWPLIIVLAIVLTRRRTAVSRRRTMGGLLALVTLASFVASAVGVANDPAGSYFFTTTRAWEFGAGGLLAFAAPVVLARFGLLRSALSWTGSAVIAASFLLYSSATPFPGFAALPPVIATLAVIWAGSDARHSAGMMFRLPPVLWLGGLSYSLYLWHWPLIVLVPFARGQELGTVSKLAVLAVALLLAVLTKKYVEDPVRTGAVFSRLGSGKTILAAASVVALLVAGSGWGYLDAERAAATAAAAHQAAVAEATTCLGELALVNSACELPFAPNVLTDPAFAAGDIGRGVLPTDECKQTLDDAAVLMCVVGVKTKPSTVIALVGDSHAGQFLEALDVYGQANGVQFRTYLKTWCSGTGADNVAARDDATPAAIDSCALWGKSVLQEISGTADISAVVFTSFVARYAVPATSSSGRPIDSQDFVNAWEELIGSGKRVIALRDMPNADDVLIPGCVALHVTEYDPCTTPKANALLSMESDPMVSAANADHRVRVVDLSDTLCTAETCHSVIGGLIVYFDSHHLSASFARTLSPIVGERILGALTQ